MQMAEVRSLHTGLRVLQRNKTQIGSCYFSFAVPIEIEDENWEAWMCEDRETGAVNAVNLELGFTGGVFFGASETTLFDFLLEQLTEDYGPPQRRWKDCHNPLGNLVVQYRWYFPSTIITLLERDPARNWSMVRFERYIDRREYGPGICHTPPVDLPE
jgi:hypothetical protein